MAESARLAAEATAALQLDPAAAQAAADPEAPAARRGASPGAQDDKPETKLWVDKYAPAGFMQLLSDEWINREVAKWTRSWLPGFQPDPADEEDARQSQGAGAGQKRKWGAGGRWGRGRRRAITRREAPMLLICGPPGAWVTHGGARHAC